MPKTSCQVVDNLGRYAASAARHCREAWNGEFSRFRLELGGQSCWLCRNPYSDCRETVRTSIHIAGGFKMGFIHWSLWFSWPCPLPAPGWQEEGPSLPVCQRGDCPCWGFLWRVRTIFPEAAENFPLSLFFAYKVGRVIPILVWERAPEIIDVQWQITGLDI